MATHHLIGVFPQGKIVHRDEVSLKGCGREVKADLWIDGRGVSVKMAGPVQLSSAEGKRTASILNKVYQVTKLDLNETQKEHLRIMIQEVREMPTVMVSSANKTKAEQRHPHKFAIASNYDVWKAITRPALNERIRSSFDIESFKLAAIEEMLTGRLWFENREGVADYILTPNYFKYIDRAYVRAVAKSTVIDIRGKSRGGISSGVVRFDTKI